jgi:hypothetical protein
MVEQQQKLFIHAVSHSIFFQQTNQINYVMLWFNLKLLTTKIIHFLNISNKEEISTALIHAAFQAMAKSISLPIFMANLKRELSRTGRTSMLFSLSSFKKESYPTTPQIQDEMEHWKSPAIQASNAIFYESMYVAITTVMALQRENKEKDIQVIIDNREDGLPDEVKFFKRSWPTIIVSCQKSDNVGSMFTSIPQFDPYGKADTRLETITIWKVSALVTRIELLWKFTAECDMKRSRWHGRLFVYLTKIRFPEFYLRQDNRDPFKFRHISSIDQITAKTNFTTNDNDFRSIFYEIDKVS